jgi:hypothetical protein
MKAIIEAAKNEPKVHVVNPAPAKQEKPVQAGQAAASAAETERIKAEKEAVAAARREPESIAKRIVSHTQFTDCRRHRLKIQPQGLKAMHPLLKQARTFETQRLIKKIKWSRWGDLLTCTCFTEADLPERKVKMLPIWRLRYQL